MSYFGTVLKWDKNNSKIIVICNNFIYNLDRLGLRADREKPARRIRDTSPESGFDDQHHQVRRVADNFLPDFRKTCLVDHRSRRPGPLAAGHLQGLQVEHGATSHNRKGKAHRLIKRGLKIYFSGNSWLSAFGTVAITL